MHVYVCKCVRVHIHIDSHLLPNTRTDKYTHTILRRRTMRIYIPVSAPVLEAVCCIGQSGCSTAERSSSHVDNKISIWHSRPILSIC